MIRILISLLLAALLLPAAAIEHGDRDVAPRRFTTQQPLYIVTQEGAAAGWLQLYVFHPERREETIAAALQCGVMTVLPAGSTLVLRQAARNGGAYAVEIAALPAALPPEGKPVQHEPTAAERAGDGQAYALPAYRPAARAEAAVGRLFCCSSGDLHAAATPDP